MMNAIKKSWIVWAVAISSISACAHVEQKLVLHKATEPTDIRLSVSLIKQNEATFLPVEEIQYSIVSSKIDDSTDKAYWSIKLDGTSTGFLKATFKPTPVHLNISSMVVEQPLVVKLKSSNESPHITDESHSIVHFEFGKSDLTVEAKSTLKEIAKANESSVIQIMAVSGHTDNIGSKNFNLNLSLQRADAVKHFLITQGVNKARIVVSGEGDTKPIASNEEEAGRRLNRRAEIIVKENEASLP